MTAAARRVDVVIVGAGPAGSTTAMILSRAGWSVALIDKDQFDKSRVGEHLPPDVKPLLSQLGILESDLSRVGICSSAVESAWGTKSLIIADTIFNPFGSGWLCDRRRFDLLLAKRAAAEGAKLFMGTRVTSLEETASSWRVAVEGGSSPRTLYCRFLVDATGRSGSIARRMGARRVALDNMVAIGRYGRLIDSPSWLNSVLIESTSNGWWYVGAFGDDRIAAYYVTDRDTLGRSADLKAAVWRESLKHTVYIGDRVKRADDWSPIKVSSAASSILQPMAGKRWLAVGDAAVSVDPASSMGILRALRQGRNAALALEEELLGRQGGTAKYAKKQYDEFKAYLKERQFIYSQKKTWKNSVFWRRRNGEGITGH